jgi:hypothetical protein
MKGRLSLVSDAKIRDVEDDPHDRLAVGTRRGVLVCQLTPDPNSCSPELCLHQVISVADPHPNPDP